MSEWNRRQLWGEADAIRLRGARGMVYALALGAAAVLFGQLAISCVELYEAEPTRMVPATPIPECAVDDDCTLRPWLLTCCGECEPAPPFEAITTRTLELLRGELASDCYPPTRLCEPPICSNRALACDARAICVRGTCTVSVDPACLVR